MPAIALLLLLLHSPLVVQSLPVAQCAAEVHAQGCAPRMSVFSWLRNNVLACGARFLSFRCLRNMPVNLRFFLCTPMGEPCKLRKRYDAPRHRAGYNPIAVDEEVVSALRKSGEGVKARLRGKEPETPDNAEHPVSGCSQRGGKRSLCLLFSAGILTVSCLFSAPR